MGQFYFGRVGQNSIGIDSFPLALNVAPLQGERHGFAVPVLCMTGAPLYTQLHVYPASRQTPFHRQ
ncbi:hypothetical protein WKI72_17230 [Candidatus Erwinia dacicola]